jgi:cyclophilin family peptidyl-prolyl cis-trans isomerase
MQTFVRRPTFNPTSFRKVVKRFYIQGKHQSWSPVLEALTLIYGGVRGRKRKRKCERGEMKRKETHTLKT